MEITINNESFASKQKEKPNISYREKKHRLSDKYILLPDGFGILMGFTNI